jgi:UDP-2-acetamido-2-deoxy-ribo-hexuluronate aminotransferase
MEFIDLKKQQDRIRPELNRRIQSVLNHGQYIMGPEVAELETCLANYVGVKHCVTVASGTDALLIALMVVGVGPGDEVITTPFTFIANAETIAFLGAKPVFVDIDPKTYNIDPKKIAMAMTPKTKAILPVNLYGQCADYDLINEIVDRFWFQVSGFKSGGNRLKTIDEKRETRNQKPIIIEDAAQSFGAMYKGRRSCLLSTIGCTSFFPSKPLGCYGDGGACFTNDDGLAKVMREIRVHGSDRRYHHVRVGANGRLDTLQAAILMAKMTVFEDEVQRRQQIGARYTELLKDVIDTTPFIEPHNTHVYAQYTIRVNNRDQFISKLSGSHQGPGTNDQGLMTNDQRPSIPTSIHYPIPLHLQPVFEGKGYRKGNFPISEQYAQAVVSLPMHPYLEEEEISLVVKAVKEAKGF